MKHLIQCDEQAEVDIEVEVIQTHHLEDGICDDDEVEQQEIEQMLDGVHQNEHIGHEIDEQHYFDIDEVEPEWLTIELIEL